MSVIVGAFGGGRCPVHEQKEREGPAPSAGFLDLEQNHRDLTALMVIAADAEEAEFAQAFFELTEFAALRFAEEEAAMAARQDPLASAHARQHRWILGLLAKLRGRVEQGRFTAPRAYVRERLPRWLLQHALSMDAQLATHLALGPGR